MSQLFILQIKNESTKEIKLTGTNIDSCIEGSISVPATLEPGKESTWKTMEPQVKWDCKNGLYKIGVEPSPPENGTTKGQVTLNFDCSSTDQNEYGTVSIHSQTPAIITKSEIFSTELTASVISENDSGDECTVGVLTFKTAELAASS